MLDTMRHFDVPMTRFHHLFSVPFGTRYHIELFSRISVGIMDGAASTKRGTYIKGDASDLIVTEILKRKEFILQFNPHNKSQGAARRHTACEQVVSIFNSRFPNLGPKKWENLKTHFDTRRDGIKHALMVQRTYVGGTGGGRDVAAEKEVAKVANPSHVDSLLIDYIKHLDGALGVGSLDLETGHGMSGGDEGMDEAMSAAAFEKYQNMPVRDWMKREHAKMRQRANAKGFGGKRDHGVEKTRETVVKRVKEDPESSTLREMAATVSSLQGQMSANVKKGEAAVEGMEQLRAAIRYSRGNLTPEDLMEIVADYDRKVAAAAAPTPSGSSSDPIDL